MSHPLIAETAVITERAAATAKTTGRMLVEFITPGWGSSGYYSPTVLEQAATDVVIPKGTHMYADHPTQEEDAARPVRSVKDLMAVTTEDARLSESGSLVGEVQVVPAWRELIETVKDAIGVSIRGSATDIVEGEAEGRSGGIIEGLVAPVMSVDFVTRAGRGGKVLQVLESAAANHRAIARGVEEATVNDTREVLQTALRDAHAAADRWVYVRDFDDTTVWFEVSGEGDDAGTYAQTYTSSDAGAVTLTGDRTEVRQVTTYVSVARPDSTTTTTEADQEVTMGTKQIEESELSRLTEAAGRVATLESENAALQSTVAQLTEASAARSRRDRAGEIIAARAKEGEVTFTALESRGLLAELPVKDGALDEAALTTTVDAQVAEKKAAAQVRPGGGGFVSGFGGLVPAPAAQEAADDDLSDDDLAKTISEAFRNGGGFGTTQIKEA